MSGNSAFSQLDGLLDEAFVSSNCASHRRNLALAGFACRLLSLGLRPSECFGANWEDVGSFESRASQFDNQLLVEVGFVFRCASFPEGIVVAFHHRGDGFRKWFYRAKDWRDDASIPIFCHLNGSRWTYDFFQKTYVLPALRSVMDVSGR